MILQPTQTLLLTPGATGTSSIEGEAWISANLTWRLINDADGTIAIAESSTGIVQTDTGEDSPGVRYDRQFTAPSAPGKYLAVWRHVLDEQAQTIVIEAARVASFASPSDIELRLGRTLTGTETTTAAYLLNMAAAVIADAVDRDDGWAASLNPVPEMLRLMSAELACRVMNNPHQYSQVRQQVGSYSFAATQANAGTMVLTDAETMMLRRAVYGRTTDSVQVDSGFIQAQDEYWLRMQQPTRSQDPGVTIA